LFPINSLRLIQIEPTVFKKWSNWNLAPNKFCTQQPTSIHRDFSRRKNRILPPRHLLA